MKILFTGASSFTGFWFVNTLAERGHQVTCTYTAKSIEDYSGVRKKRIEILSKVSHPEFNILFGDEKFISLIQKQDFDILCHHAAFVQNYKEAGFNVADAVKHNTNNIYEVLKVLTERNCNTFIFTGSVFEGGEGKGSDSLPHFSPYGLSKSLSSQICQYYGSVFKMNYGKFVIPNPFGSYEDPRFTSYLMKNWLKHQTPEVSTPDYVRDNIPVTLLALYYNFFCEQVKEGKMKKISPSGIAGSQGHFTKLVSQEVAARLNFKCDFILKNQTDFREPMERINTDRVESIEKSFSPEKFWDSFVEYYRENN